MNCTCIRYIRTSIAWGIVLTLQIPLLWAEEETTKQQVEFNRDIRPLLSSKCYACHGPDEETRETELRLDQRSSALKSKAIVPGKPKQSELVKRILSHDPEVVMPPSDADETLTDHERTLLQQWIQEGAEYQEHWAFLPLQQPKIPQLKSGMQVTHPVDRFIRFRLEQEQLSHSRQADRYTLIRRVSLDLTGLPPTPEEADAFVSDQSEDAYELLVDRLLASPRYGERWARVWLDLARYADTNGYEKDRPRSIWPYRDWVIRALNDDMPFDQFSIEQLAGDMLPHATIDQKVATGFHRNTMLNEEGGIDPLEYRFYAMVDRVATTGTIWMGLTVGCAQCHSHKYDPLSQTDYYQMMALLNNAEEPDLIVPSKEIQHRRLQWEKQIEALEQQLSNKFPVKNKQPVTPQNRAKHLEGQFRTWYSEEKAKAVDWKLLKPFRLSSNLPKLTVQSDGSILSRGDITKRDLFTLDFNITRDMLPLSTVRLEVLPDDRLPAQGPGRAYYEGRKGDFFLSEWETRFEEKPLEMEHPSHSYGKISIGSGNANAGNVLDSNGSTGWSTSGAEGLRNVLVLNLKEPVDRPGKLTIELLFERHFAASLGRFRFWYGSQDGIATASRLPLKLETVVLKEFEQLSEAEQNAMLREFLLATPLLKKAREPLERLKKQRPRFPTTMVFSERSADNIRPTFRHHRGEYLSPKEQVQPDLPELFGTLAENETPNRLTFARWLVSPENPLIARVTVNRAWQAFFGQGIVRTSGDFGTQGALPTHPQLLDWLASEFIRSGWSMKKLHRLIVTSATYKQQSHVPKELLDRDPQNEYLARGARFRVDAELIRDMMLKSSGYLSTKMYGPSVYPPQPASVTALAYGNTSWKASTGEDRYRRSLYTFSKRTSPFAAYTVFDGPTGESCLARRNRSNTPLQALTLLNDEMFLEMSRHLIQEIWNKHPDWFLTAKQSGNQKGNAKRIATVIFRRFLTRHPSQVELNNMFIFQQKQQERFAMGSLSSAKVFPTQKNRFSAELHAELASWSLLARVLMNLDETITRP